MRKEIHLFIVEDNELAKKLIQDHFEKGKITYAEILPLESRPKIVEFLKDIEEPFIK